MKLVAAVRGCGTVYFALDGELPASYAVDVVSKSGNLIPYSSHLIDSLLVIAIPLLEGEDFNLSVFSSNQKLNRLFSKNFGWDEIKWISRFNYRFKSSLSYLIRDSDR